MSEVSKWKDVGDDDDIDDDDDDDNDDDDHDGDRRRRRPRPLTDTVCAVFRLILPIAAFKVSSKFTKIGQNGD